MPAYPRYGSVDRFAFSRRLPVTVRASANTYGHNGGSILIIGLRRFRFLLAGVLVSKKILVVVDPRADTQVAVERAAWLATQVSADLELFICDFDPHIDAGQSSTVWIEQPVREQLIARLQEKLDTLAAPLRDQGLKVSVDVAWDHPLHEGIVRKVRETQPWLVAKDTHHHGVLKRTILTNTDWHLIRDCPAPSVARETEPRARGPEGVCRGGSAARS